MKRDEREKQAYDENNVWEASHSWHMRFVHVFTGPNTLRSERQFDALIQEGAHDRRVFEIGSGGGITGEQILAMGASFVYGVDISETFVAQSKMREQPGKLEFECKSVSDPLPGTYDLIVGRSILHHIDYQEVLARLFKDNLNPNGMMLFMEPLGSNILLKLYWKLARNAHTPDERPFMKDDLRWLGKSFPHLELHPINLFSFFAGIISSRLFSHPDNVLMKLCDILDVWLAAHVKFLVPQFRQVIIVVRKKG
jgi:SAM-dependent methyltransferase